MRKVVLAVELLHQHQVLPRDLKPANIPRRRRPPAQIARFLAGPHTDSDFASPRLANSWARQTIFHRTNCGGSATRRANGHLSLGTSLRILTGQVPFSERSLANQLQSIRTQDPFFTREPPSTPTFPATSIHLPRAPKRNPKTVISPPGNGRQHRTVSRRESAAVRNLRNLVSGRID